MELWIRVAEVLHLLCTDRDMVRLWPDGETSAKET